MNSYSSYREMDNAMPIRNRGRLLEHRSQTAGGHLRTGYTEDGSFAYAEARPYAPTTNVACGGYTPAPPAPNVAFAPPTGDFKPIAYSGPSPTSYATPNSSYARAEYSGGVACAVASSRPVSRASSPVQAAPIPAYYPRPPSPSQRKHVFDLQDQVKIFKEEISKKDRLINQLTTLESRPRCNDVYSNESISATLAQSAEVSKLTITLEGVQSQLRDLQAQLMMKDDKIREMKAHSELGRENEGRLNITMSSLRKQIAVFESKQGEFEGSASRSEVAILTLQKEKQESAERIMELESRLRTNLADREAAEQQRDVIQKKLSDIMSSVSHFDGIASYESAGIDMLISRIEEVFKENALLKGKKFGVEERLLNAEAENKASRETIVRLVGETERGQQFVARRSHEFETLKKERDDLDVIRVTLEREVASLNERMASNQRALSATKHDLMRYEEKFVNMDRQAQSHSVLAQSAETKMNVFMEKLAHLLTSEGRSRCEPREECIRDHVTLMAADCRDKHSRISALESKHASSEEQRVRDFERFRALEHAGQRSDIAAKESENRLQRLESQYTTAQYELERLMQDKTKYMRLLEELMREIGVDGIGEDVGFDMICDTIASRCRQLKKLELDSITDRKTHIYNLQRKMKHMKDQLESKDVHLEMLRKKVSDLELRASGRSELEKERDDGYIRAKKLERNVDRYKKELNEVNTIVRDLKAKLLETAEIKNDNLGKHQLISELESAVESLEELRLRQASTITTLQEEKTSTNELVANKSQTASNTIHALSSELKTTKCALGQYNKREKQLLDFRQVISRMLGLDVNCLAVPDYEIISRLEKLIVANKSNVATVVALDGVIGDLEDGFKAGYEDAGRILAAGTPAGYVQLAPAAQLRSGARSGLSIGGMKASRSRSMSPSRRKKDKRVY